MVNVWKRNRAYNRAIVDQIKRFNYIHLTIFIWETGKELSIANFSVMVFQDHSVNDRS